MPLDPKLAKYTTASPITAVFNFQDIEDGTNVAVYYPFKGSDNSAQINIMSNQIHFTEEKGTGNNKSGALAEVLDIKFETGAFNLPRDLKGTALFRLPWKYAVAVSDQQFEGVWTITLYTYDGSTETSVATITSRTYDTAASGVSIPTNFVSMIKLPLPKSKINIGDTVRVRLQLSLANVGGDARSGGWAVGYDPKDTSFQFTGTNSTALIEDPQMAFFIPFAI
jgi:hypothetical protein